jgi:truncated hemoglobin YjbI
MTVQDAPTLFDELGGEPVLRKIIDRFVDRMFDDVMIGFFFRKASRARIKEKEYEFAAEHLGARVRYTGRALDQAHRPHAIRASQFMRRLQILKETLDEFAVPARVREHWLDHVQGLMSQVSAPDDDRCAPLPPSDGSKPGEPR